VEGEAVNGAVDAYRQIAELWSAYIVGHANFDEIEALLADAIRSGSIDQGLAQRLYHVLNHFEADADLRAKDVEYGAVTTSKLRGIIDSLYLASSIEVDRSIDSFWRW
jgi:hypothetical protein